MENKSYPTVANDRTSLLLALLKLRQEDIPPHLRSAVERQINKIQLGIIE